jgi:molybdopterin-guanine dinucleotide biosynthesis protein A
MRHVQAPLVVVLAADLPFLRGRHLRWLAGAPAPPGAGAGAVMVDDREREQWLLSVWRTDVLRDALTGYSGQSLHGVLGGLGPVRVRYPVAAGEVGPWVDCDTPEELAWVRRWHEEAEQRRRRGERA